MSVVASSLLSEGHDFSEDASSPENEIEMSSAPSNLDDLPAIHQADGPDDVTARFFETWGNAQRESRPERNLCYSMLLQAAHDIMALNHQRRWREAQEEAIYWCRHPHEGGILSLAICVDVLFPEILGQYSLQDFGEMIIENAKHICKLEFPNSNIATAKDTSPVDFLKIFSFRSQ